MEILNNAVITPQRLHALLKLVDTLRQPKREDLISCLQPIVLFDDPNTKSPSDITGTMIANARKFGLIVEDPDTQILSLSADVPKNIENPDVYRQFLQQRFAGVSHETDDNFLMNLFVAWFAVQNERVFVTKQSESLSIRFNNELFPHEPSDEGDTRQTRAFNPTKYNGWRTWASFLGWVRVYGSDEVVPDASYRLAEATAHVLDNKNWLSFSEFMNSLGEICPELDGGTLFNRAWEASRATEVPGKQLGLMLSTALRTCHNLKILELKMNADASDVWQLYPAQGMELGRISHIRRR